MLRSDFFNTSLEAFREELSQNRAASHAWAERHGVPVQTMSLAEAAARGAARWQPGHDQF
jgi:hypothetical protein